MKATDEQIAVVEKARNTLFRDSVKAVSLDQRIEMEELARGLTAILEELNALREQEAEKERMEKNPIGPGRTADLRNTSKEKPMSSTKEAARQNAIEEALIEKAWTHPIDEAREILGNVYDAGYESARSSWTAINSVEDLPNETGWYLTTLEAPFDQKSQYQFFDGKGFDLRAKVLAWRPLPEPYQQGGE